MLISAPNLWLFGAALAAAAQLAKSGDWQHLLWAALLPMLFLLATSGRMFSAGRARTALVTFVFLSSLPLVLLTVRGGLDQDEVTAVESPAAALQEVVLYGFTGEVPDCMEPKPDTRAAREGRKLGSPSRDVTVPMGALFFGSVAIFIMGLTVILSKAFPMGPARIIWLNVAPLSVFVASHFVGGFRSFEQLIWKNDPTLVAALGPLMAAAAVVFLVTVLLPHSTEEPA